jgi:hypothetical protein
MIMGESHAGGAGESPAEQEFHRMEAEVERLKAEITRYEPAPPDDLTAQLAVAEGKRDAARTEWAKEMDSRMGDELYVNPEQRPSEVTEWMQSPRGREALGSPTSQGEPPPPQSPSGEPQNPSGEPPQSPTSTS